MSLPTSDQTKRTRTRATARPRLGWLAETVTVPAEPGSDRIQTAPTPPAAEKSNGLSPTSTAGPSTSKTNCPVTYGRGAPYRSTTPNASRVASTPSPSISARSAAGYRSSPGSAQRPNWVPRSIVMSGKLLLTMRLVCRSHSVGTDTCPSYPGSVAS